LSSIALKISVVRFNIYMNIWWLFRYIQWLTSYCCDFPVAIFGLCTFCGLCDSLSHVVSHRFDPAVKSYHPSYRATERTKDCAEDSIILCPLDSDTARNLIVPLSNFSADSFQFQWFGSDIHDRYT
jgi:hypothetical protein